MQLNNKSSEYNETSYFSYNFEKDKIIPFRAKKAFDEISKIHKFNKNSKILDIGIGTGDLLNLFYKEKIQNLFGSDFNNYVKYNILKDFEENDIEKKAPFGNEQFDLVICTEVLEHTFNPVMVMENLISKVKPGGYLFISMPLELGLLNRIRILFGYNINNPLGIGSHIKYFKEQDIDKLLQKFPELEEVSRFYNSLIRVGLYDDRLPILSTLANFSPDIFGGLVGITLRKK